MVCQSIFTIFINLLGLITKKDANQLYTRFACFSFNFIFLSALTPTIRSVFVAIGFTFRYRTVFSVTFFLVLIHRLNVKHLLKLFLQK